MSSDPYWRRANAALAAEQPGDPAIVPSVDHVHRRLRRKARVDRGRIGRIEIACMGWIIGVTAIACTSHRWMGMLFS